MPPALSSDDEGFGPEESKVELTERSKARSTSDDSITVVPAAKMVAAEDEEENGEEVVEDEDDEQEEDEYIVEAILTHMLDDAGHPQFKVKWQGYEKKSDQTWEPEENLKEGAKELLQEYYEKVGGREFVVEGKKKAAKRGRPSATSETPKGNQSKRHKAVDKSDSATPQPDEATTKSRNHSENEPFVPPTGSWEEAVKSIDTIEDRNGDIFVFLLWTNGRRSVHPREMCNRKCPQKMLKFYEQHTSIIPLPYADDAETNTVVDASKKARGRPRKNKDA